MHCFASFRHQNFHFASQPHNYKGELKSRVLGKDSQDKAAGEDSQGRTAVAGKRQQDSKDKTAGEDSRERTTVAGKRREDSQTDKTGKLDRTART